MALRVLVGIVYYGTAKGYCRPNFDRMMQNILRSTEHDIEVAWASENASSVPIYADHLFNMPMGLVYSDDILPPAHTDFLDLAEDMGYDKMVWQGVDMFYNNVLEFGRLVSHDVDLVSALVAARTDSRAAVARRFVRNGKGYTAEQVDIPAHELEMWNGLVEAGYPSSDNLVIRNNLFDLRLPDFQPWYKKLEDGEIGTCYEEDFCLAALNRGAKSYVDTSVRPFHVHDVDLVGRQYRGVEVPLSVLWSQ